MKNEYGLDVSYFESNLAQIQRDLSRYTPDELARALARLSVTADAKVLHETEFSALPGIATRYSVKIEFEGDGIESDYLALLPAGSKDGEVSFDEGCFVLSFTCSALNEAKRLKQACIEQLKQRGCGVYVK
jgi:hypothetical protein